MYAHGPNRGVLVLLKPALPGGLLKPSLRPRAQLSAGADSTLCLACLLSRDYVSCYITFCAAASLAGPGAVCAVGLCSACSLCGLQPSLRQDSPGSKVAPTNADLSRRLMAAPGARQAPSSSHAHSSFTRLGTRVTSSFTAQRFPYRRARGPLFGGAGPSQVTSLPLATCPLCRPVALCV